MSGIDDLRQTGTKENKVPVRVQIGDSESKNPEISNRIPRSSHTFVPDNTREKILAQQKVMNQEENKNRVTVDLTSMNLPKSETETAGVEIRENFVTDILEGEDSIFGKYIKEKEEEAKQWMEEKAMEEEIEGKIDEWNKILVKSSETGVLRVPVNPSRNPLQGRKIQFHSFLLTFSSKSNKRQLLPAD